MGVGVSGWQMAKAVSRTGELGVVSGTALDLVLARTLQLGDEGGHLRRALEKFPLRGVADQILASYFVEGGKAQNSPFKSVPMPSVDMSLFSKYLMIAGAFVAIYLAKEGHGNMVGINLLEKIQIPILPICYGAMLAGVDVVLMGAGIPKRIPAALDRLAVGQEAAMRLDIPGCEVSVHLDPDEIMRSALSRKLKRPAFVPIVSSHVLAKHLLEKSEGFVEGFVVEMPEAGGHNAPPRGVMKLDSGGEPIYGNRDEPDLGAVKALGLPFWLAGGFGKSGALAAALSLGASGIQVGTLFAFCRESGLSPGIKAEVIRLSREGTLEVFTDPLASPTGFPFKVVKLPSSLADSKIYEKRKRVCDVGLLRHGSLGRDGHLCFSCPAEPADRFGSKGGESSECAGRICLCNGLLAAIGLGQMRGHGEPEPPVVTAGDDAERLMELLGETGEAYGAEDVVRLLRSA